MIQFYNNKPVLLIWKSTIWTILKIQERFLSELTFIQKRFQDSNLGTFFFAFNYFHWVSNKD
jgi:hypothetical protein